MVDFVGQDHDIIRDVANFLVYLHDPEQVEFEVLDPLHEGGIVGQLQDEFEVDFKQFGIRFSTNKALEIVFQGDGYSA